MRSVTRQTVIDHLSFSPRPILEEIHETPSQSVLSYSSVALLLRPRAGLEGKRARRLGVQRVEDPHHPRGYRELRSKAEMRKLLDRKIVEQNRRCAICQVAFTNYSDIVPDRMIREGWENRDDHPETIQAMHWRCNGEKGSTRES